MGRKVIKPYEPVQSHSTKLVVVGKLDVRKTGMGFVQIEGREQDVRIAPKDFGQAIHGDEVQVNIFKIGKDTGRAEGRITSIIKRNTTTVVGTIEIGDGFGFLVPNNDSIHTDFFIPGSKLKNAKHLDKVVVGNIDWTTSKKNPNAEVLEIIDGIRASDIAMKEIVLQAGFTLGFSDAAKLELEKIPTTISKTEINNRKDFREVLTFTIDPADAKDFDDAISYQVLKNGNLEIGVHIADVSHYVLPGTTLDAEALARATSVYLPDRVVPMLPEKISNELCSLRPNEDKLTFSCVFEITPKAKIVSHWIGKTIIHSQRRYTYEEAEDIIAGAKGDYAKELKEVNAISQILRAERFKSGAINFSSEEVRFDLNENGEPIGIKIKISKLANQLIEELMLLANRTVAKQVSDTLHKKKAIPFPYRVHDAPDADKLASFMSFAGKMGYRFNAKDSLTLATSFNKMLVDSTGKPEKTVLETLGIRCMSKAAYTTKNIGHYGLAFEYYAHFTSPIRRYPDVLVHRVMQEILEDHVTLDAKMEEKSKHCSERERAAMGCEREANKYKQVEYMRKFLGEEFEGIISGVGQHGFWVETKLQKCEGFVSSRNCLDADVFSFVPEEYALIGLNTKYKIQMGAPVTIKVVGANLDARQLDYEWIFPQELLEAKPVFAKTDFVGKKKKDKHPKGADGKKKKKK